MGSVLGMHPDPWAMKKHPDGSYESHNGRVLVHKKGKKWVATIDGKDHEFPSKKPSFDHLEVILRREVRDLRHRASYDYDRRVTTPRYPLPRY